MKLTIVADDSAIGVDGAFFAPLDLAQLDPTVHAVQWYGEYGEVEYKTRFENGALIKPENLLIMDLTPYQFAIDTWNAAKEAAIVAEAAAAAAAEAAAQSEQQTAPVQNDQL